MNALTRINAGFGVRRWWPTTVILLLLVACRGAARPTVEPPTAKPTPFWLVAERPGFLGHPTLADYWHGRASFVVDVVETGLPLGESETILTGGGAYWSYVHASAESAGVVDQCGDPVRFPGCIVLYESHDGRRFAPDEAPVCLVACQQCPCDSATDHTDQQQYPRVAIGDGRLLSVSEYRARTMLRESADGRNGWTIANQVGRTGVWGFAFRDCLPEELIDPHPYTSPPYDCLAGAPPGIFVEEGTVYVFVALGMNPSAMGCVRAPLGSEPYEYEPCHYYALFEGSASYGPELLLGPAANPFFDFRTISSATVERLVEPGFGRRYYMFYEGVRGPGPGDGGDSQFGLGLARSLTQEIDGPWERFGGNPILVDLPGNVGLGHADVLVDNGQTILYTSLDGLVRSRLVLEWGQNGR